MSIKITVALGTVITSTSLFCYPALAKPDNHFLLLGGGGEPKRNYTIFDKEVENAGKFISSANWKSDTSFNGGHSQTEKILEQNFGKKGKGNTPFSPESFAEKIQTYKDKILSGEIKPGDQLMLQVSSHGAISNGDGLTHSIAAGPGTPQDLENLQGAKTVSLDDLEQLSALAEEKGIKLAILDFSCHSGATQALANSKTCVITSTGKNHFAYSGNNSTFSATFTKAMEKGRSLEDVFLTAMENKKYASFPTISSQEGQAIHDQVYDHMTPFLFTGDNDLTFGKLDRFLKDSTKENACRVIPKHFEKLISFSHHMENLVKKRHTFFFETKADFSPFRDSLKKYYERLNKMQSNIAYANARLSNERTEEFCESFLGPRKSNGEFPLRTSCPKYSVREILLQDHDRFQPMLDKRAKAAKSKSEISEVQADRRRMKRLKAKKQELLASNPDFLEALDALEQLKEFRKGTQIMADDIARKFSDIYVGAYREIRKRKANQSNPCRDFKL